MPLGGRLNSFSLGARENIWSAHFPQSSFATGSSNLRTTLSNSTTVGGRRPVFTFFRTTRQKLSISKQVAHVGIKLNGTSQKPLPKQLITTCFQVFKGMLMKKSLEKSKDYRTLLRRLVQAYCATLPTTLSQPVAVPGT